MTAPPNTSLKKQIPSSKGSKPLSLGVTLRGKESRHYLRGQLDELYIFDGYMTESQIKQLIRVPIRKKQSLEK
jgi:hypothetical protein